METRLQVVRLFRAYFHCVSQLLLELSDGDFFALYFSFKLCLSGLKPFIETVDFLIFVFDKFLKGFDIILKIEIDFFKVLIHLCGVNPVQSNQPFLQVVEF